MSAKTCGEVGCCWQPCSQMKVFNAWLRGHAIAGKERESTLMSFHAFLPAEVFTRCRPIRYAWERAAVDCRFVWHANDSFVLVKDLGVRLNDTESRRLSLPSWRHSRESKLIGAWQKTLVGCCGQVAWQYQQGPRRLSRILSSGGVYAPAAQEWSRCR